MDNTAQNINALMDLSNSPISANELAKRTGLHQPTIHRIRTGESKEPRMSNLRAIADYFGVTVEQLRTESSESILALAKQRVREPIRAYEVRSYAGDEDVIDRDHEVLIDEVDVVVSGGPGNYVPEFIETKFRQPFQLYWFKEVGAKPENVKIMRVDGHSMERTLFHRDRIMIDTADKRVVDGRVYAFIVAGPDGGAKVKRLFLTSDGRLRIVSDNPDKLQYPDEFLEGEDYDNVYIIGRVIDRSGRGGL